VFVVRRSPNQACSIATMSGLIHGRAAEKFLLKDRAAARVNTAVRWVRSPSVLSLAFI